jgi:hypothetical protein
MMRWVGQHMRHALLSGTWFLAIQIRSDGWDGRQNEKRLLVMCQPQLMRAAIDRYETLRWPFVVGRAA